MNEEPITCLQVFENALKKFNVPGLDGKTVFFKNPVTVEVEFDDDVVYSHAASYMIYKSCVTFKFLGKNWAIAIGEKDLSPMANYLWCDLMLLEIGDCLDENIEIDFADKTDDEPFPKYSVFVGSSRGYIRTQEDSAYSKIINDWQFESICDKIVDFAIMEPDVDVGYEEATCLSKATYKHDCGDEVARTVLNMIFQ